MASKCCGIHLTVYASDRSLATQIQIGKSAGEIRTDLRGLSDAMKDVRTEVIDKLEQSLIFMRSVALPKPGSDDTVPDQTLVSENLAVQLREVKDALEYLASGRSQKTPETRILENVYYGNPMFRREETLKPAEDTTFRWFVEGVSSELDGDGRSTSSADLSREDPFLFKQRAEVASRFEEWLRSGCGIFHISGKAGSGKSTLMKLILSTERTHELLREWAGGTRLLFARFYFWAAGEQIQNSLEGLQRSILFEILIQRPDLVKEVFCEAYPTVAHTSWDSPIHSRFFTTASFQRAFERFLNLPVDPRYRICLFIDGLDEYGADIQSGSLPETQREDLAQSLVDWSSNDRVKLLISSRPHSEFMDTFAEDQRIHLHQLTLNDMIKFGCRLFEKHRVFRFPGVKEHYRSLVERVAHTSSGVFLWTGLTIQRLLASLARRDSFESLDRQLAATPRDLSVLYEKMFLEIDENDRKEAMKMMLLVSEERKYYPGFLSHPGGINALAISWLDSLENLDCPANQPFLVYSEAHVEERRQLAESRVNGYTRGLLEITSSITPGNKNWEYPPLPYYMRHTVQFFHRTALEYVANSSLAHEVRSSSPTLFNLDFYTRLSLAELHFTSPSQEELEHDWPSTHSFPRYPAILRQYFSSGKPCQALIEAYRAAFKQHARYGAWGKSFLGLNMTVPLRQTIVLDEDPSFDHWVASEVEAPYAAQYLSERIQSFPHLLRPQGGLSLLLSVACRQLGEDLTFSRLERVKTVLALGASLQDGTFLSVDGMNTGSIELSVWQAWCLYYVTAQLSGWGKDKVRLFPQRYENEIFNHIIGLWLLHASDGTQ